MKNQTLLILFALLSVFTPWGNAQDTKKLVLMAGRPSHPPRMHEFNAGVQLLAKCLNDFPGLDVEVVLNGWPKDESCLLYTSPSPRDERLSRMPSAA